MRPSGTTRPLRIIAEVEGIEPSLVGLESTQCPALTPIFVEDRGFEPRSPAFQADAFTRLAYLPLLARMVMLHRLRVISPVLLLLSYMPV